MLPLIPCLLANTLTPLPSEGQPQLQILMPRKVLPPQATVQQTQMRPLPGKLDQVPVFNSNSPEIIKTEGILLSTFPPKGMLFPGAHLNFAFKGRFDFFSHHTAQAKTRAETHTLIQGVIVHNPNPQPVKLKILQAASYLTRPNALFMDLPDYVDNPLGNVFSGPGSRVMNDILRGIRHGIWPETIEILPGASRMLLNLPIPVNKVTPTSNTRSTLMRLSSNGPVYLADLAMYAPLRDDSRERMPTLEEWQKLLVTGQLSGPRDLAPTPITVKIPSRVIYGRVAGVALGSRWKAQITDDPSINVLSIPSPGNSFSYGLSTLYNGTIGTRQIQSAKMLVRYPDTAYHAHGNYGIEYNLTLPLYNSTKVTQTVVASIETPLKIEPPKAEMLFFSTSQQRIFFRGTVRVRYTDNQGLFQTRYVHIVQRRGQQGEPLVKLNIPPGQQQVLQVDLLYPPDAIPPQVLTVKTLGVTPPLAEGGDRDRETYSLPTQR